MEKEYIFILGRNPELSKQEVFSYLEKKQNKIIESETKSHALYIKVSKNLEKNTIKNLGGTISILEVTAKGKLKTIIEKLEETYFDIEKNKINFSIWNFANEEDYDQILNYLKKRFKSEKIKATFRPLSEKMELQNEKIVDAISSKKPIDKTYCIFEKSNKLLFSKTIQISDYQEIEKRDMLKPTRRPKLSIPPRLSKIMINLSEIKEGESLLDPFCGIGSLLQEALLQNIKVIGIDKDEKAIQGAKKNLVYAKFSKENYTLINKDSQKVKLKRIIQGIVTEPDLGKILRKMPTKQEAEKTLRNFQNLISNTINNFKSKTTGKIVFTSPTIKTSLKRISIKPKSIEKTTGLKIKKGFPIKDFRKNKIVGREIFVLEKN